MCVEEAAVIVTAEKDIKTTCTITLTSPIMREEGVAEGGTRQQSQVWGTLYCSSPGLTPYIFLRNIFTKSNNGEITDIFLWLL